MSEEEIESRQRKIKQLDDEMQVKLHEIQALMQGGGLENSAKYISSHMVRKRDDNDQRENTPSNSYRSGNNRQNYGINNSKRKLNDRQNSVIVTVILHNLRKQSATELFHQIE